MPAIPIHSDAQVTNPHQALPTLQHLVRRIFTTSGSAVPQTLAARALQTRQDTIAIPTAVQGLDSGPAPGTVVGITLGSVAGFILLVWLFSALNNNRNSGTTVTEEEVVVRRSRSPRSRRSRRSEMASRSPRRERIVRQERIVRDTSRSAPRRDFVVNEERSERRVEGDDIVEVIEEESSVAPRRKSKRGSGYRSVDPGSYAGGDYPLRSIHP